jgi:hypothetical protein
MSLSGTEAPKPRAAEVALVWQFLRIVYLLVQAYGLNRALGRMDPAFLTSGPLGGWPYPILIDIAGMVAFVGLHGLAIRGLVTQERWAPAWLLRCSALAAAWNFFLAVLFIKPPIVALYSLIPLCFALWFGRQPAVRAYFKVVTPLNRWQTLKVGRFEADVVVGLALVGVMVVNEAVGLIGLLG